jgi:hypothetical protein
MNDDELEADAVEHEIARQQAVGTAIERTIVAGGKGVVALLLGALADLHAPGSGSVVATGVRVSLDGVSELRRGLSDASAREAMRGLADRAPEIEANLSRLVDAGEGSASDLRAIIEQFLAAISAQGDRRVRELIENAAVNAFNPAKYAQGVTRRVLAFLSELEYPDIELLRRLYRESVQNSGGRPPTPWNTPGSLDGDHATRLLERRLIRASRTDGVMGHPEAQAAITQMGIRLLEHIDREEGARQAREIDAAVSRGSRGDPG